MQFVNAVYFFINSVKKAKKSCKNRTGMLFYNASAEVLKWSKRRHSKCFRPFAVRGFESHPLRETKRRNDKFLRFLCISSQLFEFLIKQPIETGCPVVSYCAFVKATTVASSYSSKYSPSSVISSSFSI